MIESISMVKTHPGHFGSGPVKPEAEVSGLPKFADVFLKALDGVSAAQNNASAIQEQAIVDPDSVDIHDITIAQAQARMAVDIATSVLNRAVQGWKDIINTR